MSSAAAKLFVAMSIEHSLRDLWQQILWDGWALRQAGGRLRHDPVDRELAVLWNAWLWRQEMLLNQGAGVDALFESTRVSANKHIEPVVSPTVIGIGGSSKADRRFRFGTVSGREPGQNWHRTEATIVNDSYLEPFLDSPLPAFSYSLSCRDLQRAWCVLRDCAWVLASRSKDSRMRSVDEVEASSLLVSRAELERAIIHCAKLDTEATQRIIDFFTCDIENTGKMFTKGLWASPIVSVDEGKNVALTLAPIAIGSTIRRIEEWLDRGGLSDRLSEARRGLKYEAWVRQEIRKSLSDSEFLQNARCAEASINREGQLGEQIDLLILLGNKLIVGEIKCLLAPVESVEHYNYLSKLNEAGAQAVRKAEWTNQNEDIVAQALGVASDRIASATRVPIVVVNQGIGFGLQVNGARVVDFHFLNLYLSENEYMAGMAVRRDDGAAIPHYVPLYDSEQEAASNLEETLSTPPPLQRYISAAVWKDNEFPMSNGENLLVANCHMDTALPPETKRLADLLQPEQHRKRRRRLR
jgi:hypothetical protein